MKKVLLLTLFVTSLNILFAQVPFLYYDFELNTNRATFENAVEQAINSGSSAVTSVGLTSVTGGPGSGTANSGPVTGRALQASGWSTSTANPGTAAADYFQFVVNTSGLSGISVGFQTANETGGPQKLGVLYSTNSTTFSSATSADNNVTTSWSIEYFDLGVAADNKSSVTIRVYGYAATNTSKLMWMDNLLVLASNITASKTLLDQAAMGVSLTSGYPYQMPFPGFTISGTATTVTLKSPIAIDGAINISATTALDCKDYAVTGNGLVTVNAGGILKIGSLNTTDAIDGNIATISDAVFATGSTVELNGSAQQYIGARTFSNVIINNTSGVTAKGNIGFSNLSLAAGNLSLATTTCTINGQLSRTSGTLTTTGTLVFSGITAQSIPANAINSSLNNVTINNSNGVTINDAETIAGTLNLTAGFLAINGQTLTLSGSITGAGSVRGSATSNIITTAAVGTLKMDGSTDGITNALGSVTVNGNITVGSKLHLFTTLTVSSGTLNANGQNIVFKSNSANTARIAPLGATASITNATNITAERWFANSGRRYRLVAPGVTTTSSMRANWMEGAMNTTTATNVNLVPGFGIQITGSGGNANGFDATQTNSTSMYSFNQSTGLWEAVTNTNGILNATTSYLTFIRGDRSTDMNSTANPLPSSAATLRATGTIKTGTQTLASLNSNGGFSLIANPFLSPVNWAAVYTNNSTKFESFYTYWEPRVGTRGGYVTVTNTGLKSNASSGATTEIQSGQAVFVKTKTAVTSPSLLIREQDKSVTSNINVFRTTASTAVTEQFFSSLYFNDAAGVRTLADGVLTAFNTAFSAAVNDEDATQIANWDEDVAIVREGKSLSIETRPSILTDDTVYLSTARLKVQAYEWQFNALNTNASQLMAFLVDNYKNTQTVLNLASPTVVPFAVTADAASAASDRFMIVFKNIIVLPVNFTSVKAAQQGNNTIVEWKTASEQNVIRYEVEKSTNANLFTKIGEQNAKGGSNNSYEAIDGLPVTGNNYYRIKAIDASGNFIYSTIVNVKPGAVKANVVIYPNPVVGNNINLELANLNKGRYIVELLSMTGQKVLIQSFDHDGGTSAQQIKLDSNLAKGAYQLKISGAGSRWTMQVIK